MHRYFVGKGTRDSSQGKYIGEMFEVPGRPYGPGVEEGMVPTRELTGADLALHELRTRVITLEQYNLRIIQINKDKRKKS